MPIPSRFSTSADGRLQALPSLPSLEEPLSPQKSTPLEEQGALQGVAAIADSSHSGQMGSSTIDDALLVSHTGRARSSRKLHSL